MQRHRAIAAVLGFMVCLVCLGTAVADDAKFQLEKEGFKVFAVSNSGGLSSVFSLGGRIKKAA